MVIKRSEKDFENKWFSYDKLDFSEPICNECDHRILGTVTCKAYPVAIPEEILTNDVDHRKRYTGDNGITFKKRT